MWKVDECADANGFATIRPDDGSANGDTDAQPLATVYDWNAARIMAAAPAMLAALEASEGVLSWLADQGNAAAPGVRDMVRAAIAKATGEVK